MGRTDPAPATADPAGVAEGRVRAAAAGLVRTADRLNVDRTVIERFAKSFGLTAPGGASTTAPARRMVDPETRTAPEEAPTSTRIENQVIGMTKTRPPRR